MDTNQLDPNDEVLLHSIESDPNLAPEDAALVRSIRTDHALSSLQTQIVPQSQREQIAGMPIYNTGIPGIGKVADWTVPVARWLKENAAQPVQELGQEAGGGIGKLGILARGTANVGSSLIPQTPGQVKLNLGLPLAAEGAGMIGKGILSIPGVSETIGNTIQALSRLSAPLVEKVLATPEILSRYLPLDQAGEVMSNFFGQLGLKSGSEALASEAENMGKAAPKLGNFAPIADKTVQAIKNEPQTLQSMGNLEQEANQLAAQLNSSNDPQMVAAAHQRLTDISSAYKNLQSQLPNAQDAITTRQYLSKVTSKMANQAAEEQVVSPIANANKGLVDDYLDREVERLSLEAFKDGTNLKPINVPGYGEVTTPQQVRQVYHEAKIGDAFSSFFPQNRNGQVDALRTFLGVLSGSPKALLESPQVWKQGIKGAAILGNPEVASNAAQIGTSISNLTSSKEQQ